MIDRFLLATGQHWVSFVRHHCVNADLVTDAVCIKMGTPLYDLDVGRIFYSGQAISPTLVRIENISVINTSQQNASEVAQVVIQQYPETYPILCRIVMGTISNGTIERIERIVKTKHYITWIMVRCQVYPNGTMDIFINLISGPPDLTPIHITAILIICKKIGYSRKDQEYKYLLDDPTTYY